MYSICKHNLGMVHLVTVPIPDIANRTYLFSSLFVILRCKFSAPDICHKEASIYPDRPVRQFGTRNRILWHFQCSMLIPPHSFTYGQVTPPLGNINVVCVTTGISRWKISILDIGSSDLSAEIVVNGQPVPAWEHPIKSIQLVIHEVPLPISSSSHHVQWSSGSDIVVAKIDERQILGTR